MNILFSCILIIIFIFNILSFNFANSSILQSQISLRYINFKTNNGIYKTNSSFYIVDYDKHLIKSNDSINWEYCIIDNKNNSKISVDLIYSQNNNDNILIITKLNSSSSIVSVSNDGESWVQNILSNITFDGISPHHTIPNLLIGWSNIFLPSKDSWCQFYSSTDMGITWNSINNNSITQCNIVWEEKKPEFYGIHNNDEKLNPKNNIVYKYNVNNNSMVQLFNNATDLTYTENFIYFKINRTVYYKSRKNNIKNDYEGFIPVIINERDPSVMELSILGDSIDSLYISDSLMVGRFNFYVLNTEGSVTFNVNNITHNEISFEEIKSFTNSFILKIYSSTPPMEVFNFKLNNVGTEWSRLVSKNSQVEDYFPNPIKMISDAQIPGLVIMYANNDTVTNSIYPSSPIGVFISDNFSNWSPLLNESYTDGQLPIISVGGFGSCIVISHHDGNQRKLSYTFDQGKTLNSIEMDNDNIEIVSIFNSDFNSCKFLVNDETDSTYSIDLTPVLPEVCKEDQLNYFSSSCSLGKMTQYYTVKNGEGCYLDKSPILSTTSCECSYEDFKCEDNYELEYDQNTINDLTGTNKTNSQYKFGCTPKSNKKSCKDGEWYFETKGYKLIQGTQCEGGLLNSTLSVPEYMQCNNFINPESNELSSSSSSKYLIKNGMVVFSSITLASTLSISLILFAIHKRKEIKKKIFNRSNDIKNGNELLLFDDEEYQLENKNKNKNNNHNHNNNYIKNNITDNMNNNLNEDT
ncbi:hypothetical protein DICPUDRAFT_146910 [Dictyostelium purpureum]|uniref:VPS10 domain-containing protein n=1 Tax=Dictyostelium purpureum TaxID=5786 RepID=F0Z775_DICPU|nr:uncharacterized protein DICPUDRAFT_146910 [Dictyostelium purpureum]EGC40195.1 hypothetical protein DICPUDRAFT_146910 [Dictyostelium purpureum]|eukprot:XP_003283264.1 hypothetical protein DICPUDRAFT_146910 [Dictyostelium purpureum]